MDPAVMTGRLGRIVGNTEITDMTTVPSVVYQIVISG